MQTSQQSNAQQGKPLKQSKVKQAQPSQQSKVQQVQPTQQSNAQRAQPSQQSKEHANVTSDNTEQAAQSTIPQEFHEAEFCTEKRKKEDEKDVREKIVRYNLGCFKSLSLQEIKKTKQDASNAKTYIMISDHTPDPPV